MPEEDRIYLMSEGERRKINRGEKTFRKRRKILRKGNILLVEETKN